MQTGCEAQSVRPAAAGGVLLHTASGPARDAGAHEDPPHLGMCAVTTTEIRWCARCGAEMYDPTGTGRWRTVYRNTLDADQCPDVDGGVMINNGHLPAPRRTRTESWMGSHVVDGDRLPPDFTPNLGRSCAAQTAPDGFVCTRLPGHTGRHAAGDSHHIVAVWP
jgi:hypothetical protein